MPGCVGCPMYQNGSQPFVEDELIANASVAVVGQNPGYEEERAGKPFVGATGQTMERHFFPEAGLVRGENVSLCNALRCRWQGGNKLPSGKALKDAVRHCSRYDPDWSTFDLVIVQGAVAKTKWQEDGSITEWRGFLLEGVM